MTAEPARHTIKEPARLATHPLVGIRMMVFAMVSSIF